MRSPCCLMTLAASAGEDGASRAIGPEVVDRVDRHELGETRAGAADAALDGADRTFADLGRLLVGEAGRTDQDQRLALIRRQLRQRRAEFLQLDAALLIGLRLHVVGILAFDVLHLAPPLAVLRPEKVA